MNLNSYALLCLSFRITANLGCPMKLHKYPLDTQVCPMEFESCKFLCFHVIKSIAMYLVLLTRMYLL